jgi:UDP-N-acetylmuramate-alanine ligase
MLVDGMKAHGIDAHLTPTFDDTEAWLLKNGREGDLVLTMSCGDIHLLNKQMQRNWDALEASSNPTEGTL